MHGSPKKILISSDWFEPGYRAGGPIRSCVNFVRHLKSEYEIYVLTSDRDLNETQPYENITADKWIDNDSFYICYLSPRNQNYLFIKKQIDSISPDFIYLNSMFSPGFSIIPLVIGKFKSKSVQTILAPRGMLKESALNFKPLKKQIFLWLLNLTSVAKNLKFHATSNAEKMEIERTFGPKVKVAVLPNFSGYIEDFHPPLPKEPGSLKIIFIGRIHPIKNLDLLLLAIGSKQAEIHLTIVGGKEDQEYFNKCQVIVNGFSRNLKVTFAGELQHGKIRAEILKHHIFALPTKGENFGHAIYEALSLGRPVLISDQTPWRNLNQFYAGWDCAIEDKMSFSAALDLVISFNQEDYNKWSLGAWSYLKNHVNDSDLVTNYKNLFS